MEKKKYNFEIYTCRRGYGVKTQSLRVRENGCTFFKPLFATIVQKGWEYMKIGYDKEEKVMCLIKSDKDFDSIKVTQNSGSHINKLVPEGCYTMIEDRGDRILLMYDEKVEPTWN